MITVGVYGVVALIVKMDDVGLALARSEGDGGFARFKRALGGLLVRGMPKALTVLSTVGTAAMLWVGGQIVLHGLETFGLGWPAHVVHTAAEAVAAIGPQALHGALAWVVSAALSGVFGLALGLFLIPVASYVVAPVMRAGKRLFGGRVTSEA
jgi:hypothetical protein